MQLWYLWEHQYTTNDWRISKDSVSGLAPVLTADNSPNISSREVTEHQSYSNLRSSALLSHNRLFMSLDLPQYFVSTWYCWVGYSSETPEQIIWSCGKHYSIGIANYLFPAVKQKTGLTALTTAAALQCVKHHELYVLALLKSSGGNGDYKQVD